MLTVGEGDTGQLGLGEDVMERTKPGLVPLPASVVQVAAGGMHTACLTTDGQVGPSHISGFLYTVALSEGSHLGFRTLRT